MNQRYLDYALYNIWANNRLINNLLKQDDKLLTTELVGSFPTIRETIRHIWYGETGWLSRLNGNGWETTKVNEFSGTNKELFAEWQTTSEDFKNFIIKNDVEKVLNFVHKGEHFSIPSREAMHTVFNHGSFHRGQIIMMMRQLGITNFQQTDYIEWVREKERGNA